MPRTREDRDNDMIRFDLAKRRIQRVVGGTTSIGPFPTDFDRCRPVKLERDTPWNADHKVIPITAARAAGARR